MRVHQQPGFVLHTRAYRESSLLVEAFTRDYGRLCLLSKGARRLKSGMRGVLYPFQSLLLSWAGKGELPILAAAEPDRRFLDLTGDERICAFYINELLMYLLHRYDSHPGLFDRYRQVLHTLSASSDREWLLRFFEKQLLRELGYALILDQDAQTGDAIDPKANYHYVPELGAIKDDGKVYDGIVIKGAALIALEREEPADEEVKQECKRLMRIMLGRHLGQRVLHSRRWFNARLGNTEMYSCPTV